MRQSTPTKRINHVAYLAALFSLVAFVTFIPSSAHGQSGSKTTIPPANQAGSATKSAATAQLAGSATKGMKMGLEGYCPVCIIKMKKWVRGDSKFQSTYDGYVYMFPGQEQKAAFDADPAKFVPVLGGDCIVAYKKMGKRTPGNIRLAAFHDDRLFMFSNEMAKTEFAANKATYESSDVALGGKCTVCKIEMQKDVEGKPEIAVLHHGLRYYFPAEKQRGMFVANPSKYAVEASANPQAGSATKGAPTTSGR